MNKDRIGSTLNEAITKISTQLHTLEYDDIAQTVHTSTSGIHPLRDQVSRPSHYTSHPSGVEAITIAEHYNFCIGNAIKYLWRAGLKGDSSLTAKQKEIQDLEKAMWYIQRQILNLKSEN